jgi:Flp pilus assembly protein TadG
MRLAHGRALRSRGGHRSGRERGAVLVEFAMVAMILVTVLAGTFDLGMAWRSGLGVTEAARAGARVGSGQGKALTADRSLLLSAQAAMASSDLLPDVTRVVVYRSATADGVMPSGCKTTATNSNCNVFTGTQFRNIIATSALTSTGCLTGSQSQNWCPTQRVTTQLTAQYIGVWIQIRYDYDFRLLGTSRLIERSAVMRLEP